VRDRAGIIHMQKRYFLCYLVQPLAGSDNEDGDNSEEIHEGDAKGWVGAGNPFERIGLGERTRHLHHSETPIRDGFGEDRGKTRSHKRRLAAWIKMPLSRFVSPGLPLTIASLFSFLFFSFFLFFLTHRPPHPWHCPLFFLHFPPFLHPLPFSVLTFVS